MQKKRKSGFGILPKVIAAAFAIYSTVKIISQQSEISKQMEVNASLSKQVNDQLLENDKLNTQIESAGSDEFYEAIAREKLGYVKPGERIFVDISSI